MVEVKDKKFFHKLASHLSQHLMPIKIFFRTEEVWFWRYRQRGHTCLYAGLPTLKILEFAVVRLCNSGLTDPDILTPEFKSVHTHPQQAA
jgi:hypothetical protein